MVVSVGVATFLPSPYRQGVAFVPGLAFAFIAFEMWRYIDSLDELERRLQVDAMAWTYTVAMGLAMLLGGLGMFLGWNLNPMGLILMEPLRAWRLHVLVRRFK